MKKIIIIYKSIIILITLIFINNILKAQNYTYNISTATSHIPTFTSPIDENFRGFGDNRSSVTNSRSNLPNSIRPQSTADYIKDDETQTLENAIRTYNSQFCPPNTPIYQINDRAISILKEFNLLPYTFNVNINNIIFIEGSVYKRTTGAYQISTYTNSITSGINDSLSDSIGKILNTPLSNFTTGHGNSTNANNSTVYEEKTIIFRNNFGELVQSKYWVPQIREQQKVIIKGDKQSSGFTDIIRSQILPNIFRKTYTKPYPELPLDKELIYEKYKKSPEIIYNSEDIKPPIKDEAYYPSDTR